ncbi:beta-glucosidase [Amylocystis lapponica]|nr:beta-glucosidase [Amylocystis lapponica]
MLLSASFAALAAALAGAHAQFLPVSGAPSGSSSLSLSISPSSAPSSAASSSFSLPTTVSAPSTASGPSSGSVLSTVSGPSSTSAPASSASGSISISAASSVSLPSSASGSVSADTLAGWQTLSVSSYGFSSFAVPSPSALPGVFPVYFPAAPPPVDNEGTGLVPDFAPAWEVAYAKAEALVAQLNVVEKVNITTGVGWENGRCVGNIAAVGEFPGLCLEDSPLGVRDTDFVTAFPAGITVAATWNRTMMRLRGLYMGQEHRGKGVHVALGPMMNLGRVAQAGRNWEGFSVDPFLSGETAYETVLGLQQAGVQACAKHYINNEQEYKRTQESSNVDDRTQHEIYLKPFLRSVQAGVASVMCSYNLINDTYACENDHTLNVLLKGELGFRGYVMSDWGAQMSTLSAVAGLDMSMPGDIALGSGTSWWGTNLTAFVLNDTIAEARLDDMATRILAGWYLLGQDQNYPNVSFNAFLPNLASENAHVDVQGDHYKLVREIGAASAVLLKNTPGALPLSKPRSVVLVGSDAGDAPMGPNGFADRGGDAGVLAMGWGSGTANFPYLISPLDAIQDRAREDGSVVSWWLNDWDTDGAASAALGFDVALVFVNADSGEGYISVDGNLGDRQNLTLWNNADELIQAVASVNPNTIVVAHSVGPSIVEPWIDNPNVTALIWANLPGQEAGNSIADVLYGAVNPSGRLPYTIAKNLSDYGTGLVLGGDADTIISIPYTEGLFVDYRHFDQENITPRFEFGFGLSYTLFEYENLHVHKAKQYDDTYSDLEAQWAQGLPTPAVEGSSVAIWLHRPAFTIDFEVQNTGGVAGADIPQLYVHFPAGSGEPPSLLRGFSDVYLWPGETKKVTFTVSRYDLSVWDVPSQSWVLPNGTFALSVGASSRDFRLSGTFPL